jgi:hypothetical protein
MFPWKSVVPAGAAASVPPLAVRAMDRKDKNPSLTTSFPPSKVSPPPKSPKFASWATLKVARETVVPPV